LPWPHTSINHSHSQARHGGVIEGRDETSLVFGLENDDFLFLSTGDGEKTVPMSAMHNIFYYGGQDLSRPSALLFPESLFSHFPMADADATYPCRNCYAEAEPGYGKPRPIGTT